MRYDTHSVESGSGLIPTQSLTEALSVVVASRLAKEKPPSLLL